MPEVACHELGSFRHMGKSNLIEYAIIFIGEGDTRTHRFGKQATLLKFCDQREDNRLYDSEFRPRQNFPIFRQDVLIIKWNKGPRAYGSYNPDRGCVGMPRQK